MKGCTMINKELTPRQAEYAESIPDNYRGQYIRALTKGSKPDLIKSMCYHCVCYEETILNVNGCECEICPLFNVRNGAK